MTDTNNTNDINLTDVNLTDDEDNYEDNYEDNCGNCECYGFPCLNCAEYVYKGSRGPGFDTEGVRMIHPDTPEDIRFRMQDVIYSE